MNRKHCNTCNKTKPSTSFGVRRASLDGLSSKCTECARAYDKARANAPHRIEARRKYAMTDAGKQAHRRASDKYNRLMPLRRDARVKVGNAIRDGKLTPMPCEKCGKKAQAHHDDYRKPLEVRWLCPPHHAEWHKHNKPKPHVRFRQRTTS